MTTRNADEAKVREWGFGHVFTWTDGPFVQIPSFLFAAQSLHQLLFDKGINLMPSLPPSN